MKNENLHITGMTCINCQNKILKKLRRTKGVLKADVSYETGNARVVYDETIIDRSSIIQIIRDLGYDVSVGMSIGRLIAVVAVIIAAYLLLTWSGVLNLLVPQQLGDSSMGFSMLFVTGLMTSVHCIAMCGGINLSQSLPGKTADTVTDRKPERTSRSNPARSFVLTPVVLYNLGRLISYTLIGALLGAAGMLFGSAFSIDTSAFLQGIVKIIAGILMVIMGANMLGLSGTLRSLFHPPAGILRKINTSGLRNKGPFVVGLLNGLMPCGPLQSMQLVALASADPLVGAASMFFFSLGTVPLMLGFGSIVSVLGKRFAQKVMTAGAVLVTVMGLSMLTQGVNLSGLLSTTALFVLIVFFFAACLLSNLQITRKHAIKFAECAVLFAVFYIAAVVKMPQLNHTASETTSAIEETDETQTEADTTDIQAAADDSDDADQFFADVETGDDDTDKDTDTEKENAADEDSVQIVESTLSAGKYPNIEVEAGRTVEWTITVPEGTLTGCNYVMYISEYGIQCQLEEGENVITFTPEETGSFRYSCWMGMITGTITVT